jgi:hypothetical protein
MVSIPATSGQKLPTGNMEDELKNKEKKNYQAGVGKVFYLTQRSKLEIANLERELSKYCCLNPSIYPKKERTSLVSATSLGFSQPNQAYFGCLNLATVNYCFHNQPVLWLFLLRL